MANKRGNDAIPSWSGFNYQGKVMLLYVLQKMNELCGKDVFPEYLVELEKQEDFVIIHNAQPESFHQVKATLSKCKWSSYAESFDKLLQHRNSSSIPTATCSFIVAKDIDDWNDAANTYNSSITLFKYTGKIVGVCDVKKYILIEVEKFINTRNSINGNKEVVYGELCLFLDEKIAKMHHQGAKKRVYYLTFSEIENVLLESVAKAKARDEYYLKEKIYEYSTQGLMQALENICTQRCQMVLSECEIPCAARVAYQRILSLPDLLQYCKIINPSKVDGWNNALKLISDMPQDKMEKEIFYLFVESQTPDKVDADKDAVLLHSKFCQATNGCIIPTLLDLSSYYLYGELSLQETFQAIKNNAEIHGALDGNAITAIPGGCEGILSQAEITSGWADGEEDNINNFYHGIEIVSKKELLENFKTQGGNHD